MSGASSEPCQAGHSLPLALVECPSHSPQLCYTLSRLLLCPQASFLPPTPTEKPGFRHPQPQYTLPGFIVREAEKPQVVPLEAVPQMRVCGGGGGERLGYNRRQACPQTTTTISYRCELPSREACLSKAPTTSLAGHVKVWQALASGPPGGRSKFFFSSYVALISWDFCFLTGSVTVKFKEDCAFSTAPGAP